MICPDFCDGRWHGKCIGLKTKAAIAALPDPWACASCEKKGLGQGASLEVKATCTGGKRVSMPAAAEQKKTLPWQKYEYDYRSISIDGFYL